MKLDRRILKTMKANALAIVKQCDYELEKMNKPVKKKAEVISPGRAYAIANNIKRYSTK